MGCAYATDSDCPSVITCSNLSCQNANFIFPCACGTVAASAANPWCCAGNNSVYANQAVCKTGACAAAPPSPSFLNKFTKSVAVVFSDLAGWLLSIAGGIVLLMLVIGGTWYILSGSNPNNQNTAKKIITYALLGAMLILISYAILGVISKIATG